MVGYATQFVEISSIFDLCDKDRLEQMLMLALDRDPYVDGDYYSYGTRSN